MKSRIAIPDNKIYSGLTSRADEVKENYDVEIFSMPESRISELMASNRMDAALMNPLGYGKGVTDADYRIIPGPAMSAVGYTSLGSVFFKKGLSTIEKAVTPNPEDFLVIMGKLMLAENYGMSPELIQKSGTPEELLEEGEAVIAQMPNYREDRALDITEEWFINYDMPLPLGIWVCRSDDCTAVIINAIRDMASRDLIKEEDIVELSRHREVFEPRIGKLFWTFTDEVKTSLDQTLQFLYFHQYLPEIPAVKIFGED